MDRLGDPAVRDHLEYVAQLYQREGVVPFVREVVSEVWRSNKERWFPDSHFDDTNTLGYQTSRNVSNRIVHTIGDSAAAPRVLPEVESGVGILTVDGFRLRVIKAAIECGLSPNFDEDFNWSTSATRESAARRNSSNYLPNAVEDWTLTFEADPRPARLRRIESCREVFLVWAGELQTDRTAGWLGLPQLGDRPWMGVIALWADSSEGSAPSRESEDDVDIDEEEDDDL